MHPHGESNTDEHSLDKHSPDEHSPDKHSADGTPAPGAVPFVQGVHLQRTDENVREIAELAAVLGEPAGLDGVLGDLSHQAHRSRVPARLLGRAVSEAYTWNAHDQRDRQWYPQGISTSADASDTEEIAGRRVLVTTWYSTGKDGVKRGSRISFLDLDTLKYRHVLLVYPVFDKVGNLGLRPMNVHAGGIVWAGDWLHIAATRRGFVSARVDDIMRVSGDDHHPGEFGLDGQRVSSYGHRYVLPVRSTYKAFTDDGHEQLRYSFASLDRHSDPPALLAGEYNTTKAHNRLARYQLDPATGQLQTGDDGFSRPLEVDDGGVVRMQGAVLAGGRYYATVSNGMMPGTIYAGPLGHLKPHRLALPMGPEDLAYWPSTDLLWSLTEHPLCRWIVAMKRSAFD